MGNIRTEGEEITEEAGRCRRRLWPPPTEVLTGMEFAAGIPGSGRRRVHECGAYGGEMSQIIVSCRALMPDDALHEFSKEELKLGSPHQQSFLQNGGSSLCRIKTAGGRQRNDLRLHERAGGPQTEKQPVESAQRRAALF